MVRKLLLCLLACFAFGESRAQERFVFKSLRFNEDYFYLHNDSSRSTYEKIKFIGLGRHSKTYLSLGGEERLQLFHINNEDWGETGEARDTYFFNRALLHADLWVGKHFRTFVQLQSAFALGKDFVSPVDENKLDLHQAFVEARNDHISFRIGRQELQYGSQRLISVRELPNNRQAFDAALVSMTNNNLKVDFLYGHYVFATSGVFNDMFRDRTRLWGAYAVMTNRPVGNIDIYYLGIHKEDVKFDKMSGDELRHSIGTRFWKNNDAWRFDFEGVYQFGSLNDYSIRAWTISSNSGYRFNTIKFKPEVGLKTELISGNRSYSDKKLETFNPLFPKGAYFGLAALIGPSNLMDIHPSLTVSLSDNIEWGIDFDMFWRFSKNDGIYSPGVALIYSGESARSRTIGRQLATNVDWDVSDFLSLRMEFTWFDSGDYLKTVGSGNDIFFVGATVQVKL